MVALGILLVAAGPPARDRGGPLGLRSARAIVEDREALEAEDLAQLLEAHNARRRRRGRPEHSVEDVELLVALEREDIRHRARRRPGAA